MRISAAPAFLDKVSGKSSGHASPAGTENHARTGTQSEDQLINKNHKENHKFLNFGQCSFGTRVPAKILIMPDTENPLKLT